MHTLRDRKKADSCFTTEIAIYTTRVLLTLGAHEVDDLAVVLEHVHFLDSGNVRYADPLECRCELFVICKKTSNASGKQVRGVHLRYRRRGEQMLPKLAEGAEQLPV